MEGEKGGQTGGTPKSARFGPPALRCSGRMPSRGRGNGRTQPSRGRTDASRPPPRRRAQRNPDPNVPDSRETVVLTIASSPEELVAIRELFEEYVRNLPVDLGFQKFPEEVRDLPGAYSAPGGTLLLARVGGTAAGCVGLRAGPGGAAELKRLYVRPRFRRLGIGRVLVETVVETARGRGYGSLCLDTLPTMEEAHRLYQSLGFAETEPYYDSPVAGTRFLRLEL